MKQYAKFYQLKNQAKDALGGKYGTAIWVVLLGTLIPGAIRMFANLLLSPFMPSAAGASTPGVQIPAFLCRQTDLLVAAAETGKVVNIKKGQFLSPAAMQFAVQKVQDAGNPQVMITERGTTFGYTDLVVDFRGIPQMRQFGVPVVMDVTHSLQQPNQTSGVTGGLPALIGTIAKAAIAVGADGLFIETHPDPTQAKSDGANMLRLDLLEVLLTRLVRIREAIRE